LSTETIIFIGVGIYIVLMIAIGFYASGRTHTVTEFIVAGRGLPVWLCSTTIVATWFGGGTMMGASGAAYDHGMLGVIADPIGASLGLFLFGLFFARLFRRLRILTVADYMAQRYGQVAAMAITATILFSNIAWVGAMLVAFGLIFETLTGTPLVIGIVGGALVVFVYTAVGGLWAVALTDFLQMIIIVVGLIVLLVVVMIDVGGWGAIVPRLPADTFRLLPGENTGEQWLNYLRAWAIVGLVDISAQTLMQRALAAKSERAAQNSFYLAGLGYLVFGMIPVTLGIIASVTMPELADSESVVPSLAIEHLHPVAVAVFVGALLAAIMSSADSALLGCASMIANNVLPLVKPDASQRLGLIVARAAIPGCGIIAIVVALKFQVVFDLMLDANILGLASIIVPFILGVWWRKANRTGALAAMAAGLTAWLVTLFLAPGLPADFVGLGVSLLTMLVVTPLTQTLDPPRGLFDSDGNPVEMTDRLGTLPLWRRARD
jgi:SSS family solute:Na+ symporter